MSANARVDPASKSADGTPLLLALCASTWVGAGLPLAALTVACGALAVSRFARCPRSPGAGPGPALGGAAASTSRVRVWLLVGVLHALCVRPNELLVPLALAGALARPAARLGQRGLRSVTVAALLAAVLVPLFAAHAGAPAGDAPGSGRLAPSAAALAAPLPETRGLARPVLGLPRSLSALEQRVSELRGRQLGGLLRSSFWWALAGTMLGLARQRAGSSWALRSASWSLPAGAALVLAWLAGRGAPLASTWLHDLLGQASAVALGCLVAGALVSLCAELPRAARPLERLARRPALTYVLVSAVSAALG